MIKVITFDLDDTLWDVRPALIKAEQAQNDWLLTHFPKIAPELEPDTAKARKRQLIKDQPELIHNISLFRQTFLKQLLLDAGLNADDAGKAAAEAFAEFIARRHHVALFEHAESVLTTLGQDYMLGALTNGNADVGKTPLGHFFAFALKAEEVGAAKPEAALFEAAMSRAGVGPEGLLHVGDSHEHDIVGAHRVGAASVWLSPDRADSEIADAVIGCLSELPAAVAAITAQKQR